NPDWARETAERHARDFVDRCRDQAVRSGSRMPFPAVIVSPYDAELFGHWWFEGPQWIYHVLRTLAGGGPLAAGTHGESRAAPPVQQRPMPAPSSWGRNGYNEHWITPRTDWMWRPLHEAAARMTRAVRAYEPAAAPRLPNADSLEERILSQAGR